MWLIELALVVENSGSFCLRTQLSREWPIVFIVLLNFGLYQTLPFVKFISISKVDISTNSTYKLKHDPSLKYFLCRYLAFSTRQIA